MRAKKTTRVQRTTKPTTRRIHKWTAEVFAATSGEQWSRSQNPSFVQARKRTEKAFARIARYMNAVRDPLNRKNAQIIAEAGYDEMAEAFVDAACELTAYGRGLRFGLAGAKPAELEKLSGQYAEYRAWLKSGTVA